MADGAALLAPACARVPLLERLRSASRFHFAGHGAVNWLEPLKSGLIMANEELVTVADLLSMRHFNARLASLSACETGIIRTDVLDEVVALPSAFLQSGFAGVVAS